MHKERGMRDNWCLKERKEKFERGKIKVQNFVKAHETRRDEQFYDWPKVVVSIYGFWAEKTKLRFFQDILAVGISVSLSPK